MYGTHARNAASSSRRWFPSPEADTYLRDNLGRVVMKDKLGGACNGAVTPAA